MIYVYIDKTDDGRVFYVGKGSASRVKTLKRNAKHTKVSSQCGCHREIVWETDDELAALAYEIRLVEFFGTFTTEKVHGIECNFTRGGQGPGGWTNSPETRAKMAESKRGDKNPMKRSEVSEKIAASQRTEKNPMMNPLTRDIVRAAISKNNGMKRPEVAARVWATRRARQAEKASTMGASKNDSQEG